MGARLLEGDRGEVGSVDLTYLTHRKQGVILLFTTSAISFWFCPQCSKDSSTALSVSMETSQEKSLKVGKKSVFFV